MVISSAGMINATSQRNADRSVAWNRPSHAAVARIDNAMTAMIRYGFERGVASETYEPLATLYAMADASAAKQSPSIRLGSDGRLRMSGSGHPMLRDADGGEAGNGERADESDDETWPACRDEHQRVLQIQHRAECQECDQCRLR